MSTPYVGLQHVMKSSQPGQGIPEVFPLDEHPSVPQHTGDYRRAVKNRLIRLLEERFEVQSVMVGAFQMKLSDAVPEKYLLKASEYLLEQLKKDPEPGALATMLENCVQTLKRSL
jgi:hypothetical protein